MEQSVGIALALLSAVTTAFAHALLKSGKDKLAVRAATAAVTSGVAAPVCLLVPPPAAYLLPWLAGSCALHVAYQLALIRAYDATDFAVAFPIARGTAPIATAILGALLLNDPLSLPVLLGVAMVSIGILRLGLGQSIPRAGLIAAMITGLLITAYTTVDAAAVRLPPDALTFIAWFFLLEGLAMLSLFAMLRRKRIGILLRQEGRPGVIAGFTSLISFGSALLALRLAPVGVVSALRETSVVFGILLASFMLREHVGPRRAIAALIIAAGAVAIILSSL